MSYIIFVLVSFFASVIGAICGIGGGIIIKPVLDSVGILSVETIVFLSGCTVFAMSFYSVLKSRKTKDQANNTTHMTILAIGAIIGGLIGKEMFGLVSGLFQDENRVGAIQAICLVILTIGTLIYTLKKDKIKTKKIESKLLSVVIGVVLGGLSSFLGIGGGPINLILLYYFFSMDTKSAVKGSLYIIMFSQGASVLSTILLNQIPEFEWILIILMVLSGIVGADVGHRINKKINAEHVNKLFIMLMISIIMINFYNIIKYL